MPTLEVVASRRERTRLPDGWLVAASPGPRTPMTARVERIAGPIRGEVAALSRQLRCTAEELREAQAPRVAGLGYTLDDASISVRAAWWLMGQWLLGYATESFDARTSFEEAESWFYGDAAASLPRIAPAGRRLSCELGSPAEFAALLPYVLDPLGPGTRRHVLSSAEHGADRSARKLAGVYYTPADVAHHMASSVAPADGTWTCWDPACGSGVFLRAALALRNPAERVFGCDIEPMAAEMAAFVVVATQSSSGLIAPWHRWHLARLDLATHDALVLAAGSELNEIEHGARTDEVATSAERLANGEVPSPAQPGPPFRSVGALFPALLDGADALLSNPPYAKLGPCSHRNELASRFASLASVTPTTNIYTAFVEMSWQHTKPLRGAASLVVPLSIAFHTGEQFRSLRSAMEANGGRWRCGFFDRTPDALFGDDVKTRNAIVVYHREACEPSFGVTSLLRWTSIKRADLFASMRHIVVRANVRDGLPKVGTDAESRLYEAVLALPGYLNQAVVHRAKVPASAASPDNWPHTLFIGPTAYNWFNCLRDVPDELRAEHDSDSALTALQFVDDVDADIAYALVSSRLVFWLWRVQGDAFHVSPTWLARLNFKLVSLPPDQRLRLASLGRELWESVLRTPVRAVNKGKRTVAFPASLHLDVVSAVDKAVLDAFRLTHAATDFDLDAWYRDTVVVERTDRRRLSMDAGKRQAC